MSEGERQQSYCSEERSGNVLARSGSSLLGRTSRLLHIINTLVKGIQLQEKINKISYTSSPLLTASKVVNLNFLTGTLLDMI